MDFWRNRLFRVVGEAISSDCVGAVLQNHDYASTFAVRTFPPVYELLVDQFRAEQCKMSYRFPLQQSRMMSEQLHFDGSGGELLNPTCQADRRAYGSSPETKPGGYAALIASSR